MLLSCAKSQNLEKMGHLDNTLPPFWRRINDEEFSRGFFQYILKEYKFRQFYYDQEGNRLKHMVEAKLFDVAYNGWEGLGYAITHEWVKVKGKGEKVKILFYKYGDPEVWQRNIDDFNVQFRGDNS